MYFIITGIKKTISKTEGYKFEYVTVEKFTKETIENTENVEIDDKLENRNIQKNATFAHVDLRLSAYAPLTERSKLNGGGNTIDTERITKMATKDLTRIVTAKYGTFTATQVKALIATSRRKLYLF